MGAHPRLLRPSCAGKHHRACDECCTCTSAQQDRQRDTCRCTELRASPSVFVVEKAMLFCSTDDKQKLASCIVSQEGLPAEIKNMEKGRGKVHAAMAEIKHMENGRGKVHQAMALAARKIGENVHEVSCGQLKLLSINRTEDV